MKIDSISFWNISAWSYAQNKMFYLHILTLRTLLFSVNIWSTCLQKLEVQLPQNLSMKIWTFHFKDRGVQFTPSNTCHPLTCYLLKLNTRSLYERFKALIGCIETLVSGNRSISFSIPYNQVSLMNIIMTNYFFLLLFTFSKKLI